MSLTLVLSRNGVNCKLPHLNRLLFTHWQHNDRKNTIAVVVSEYLCLYVLLPLVPV